MMFRNILRNLEEGRIVVAEGVFDEPPGYRTT
jgi:hypothetical protein